ncbi:hypothetical protein ZIOFF_021408 [Zingiber officinale]|uniref:Uncharacterized protein n=1 Tax=Zingiber officinale TaxID=94328 RepID=A0A8J5HBR4_ZINOF|nr:hypothetical protein ZIOFF_021408 [Zingiber officinale]
MPALTPATAAEQSVGDDPSTVPLIDIQTTNRLLKERQWLIMTRSVRSVNVHLLSSDGGQDVMQGFGTLHLLSSINSNDAIPQSDVNREYFAEEHDRKARAGVDYES